LATAAVLVMALGLLVDLARHVRIQSARSLTQALLYRLDAAMAAYCASNAGAAPQVVPMMPPDPRDTGDETALQRQARVNNRQFMDALLARPGGAALVSDLPLSIFDPQTQNLRDAWGAPIIFMAHTDAAVGMAPQGSWFFFSAGPDRKYLTRADNLYSYEAVPAGP